MLILRVLSIGFGMTLLMLVTDPIFAVGLTLLMIGSGGWSNG